MPSHSSHPRRKPPRSSDQIAWNACVGLASRAWEWLSDDQRLTWNVQASTDRTSGQRLFVKVNARRLYDRKQLLTEYPPPQPFSPERHLLAFVITNRRGRLTLMLRVSPGPAAHFTVWASRPLNQGVSVCHNIPRLGPLPAQAGEWADFTELYYRKHAPCLKANRLPLVGKRIIVNLRQELDNGAKLVEQLRALIPPPEPRSRGSKKP